jgi:hypothetical protein
MCHSPLPNIVPPRPAFDKRAQAAGRGQTCLGQLHMALKIAMIQHDPE